MSIAEMKGAVVPVKLWAPIHEVESSALDQLRNIAGLPWVFHHVAVMPDCHLGKGATVGSVIATRGAVSPNAVGVDIGCGMLAVRTSLKASDLPDSLASLRAEIEAAIPVGNGPNGARAKPPRPEDFDLSKAVRKLFDGYGELKAGEKATKDLAVRQLGTLGGGNHFIELCLDSGVCPDCNGSGDGYHDSSGTSACYSCDGDGKWEPRVWLMLHSGSRGIGNEIAKAHIGVAKRLGHNQRLTDPDLAAFLSGTPEMVAYRRDLYWAQEYARLNREVMLADYRAVLAGRFAGIAFDEPVACHHNYVAEERHYGEEVFVTRKGAIRAGRGELGIIPGSMGTRSYIVRGLGNPESYCSASHGAGRRMSRSEAGRRYTVADVEAQTAGVECRKDVGVVDEIPAAYKSIDEVMANQRDLVEIVAELKAVLCVKG